MTNSFVIFRPIFGAYILWHLLDVLPYVDELFGDDMPYDYKLSPIYGILPNIVDDITSAYFILMTMIFFSILYTIGFAFKLSSLILYVGWTILFNRNFLISNPGIPYVGWILLASMFVPKNGPIPKKILFTAYFLLMLGYTLSGLHKLYFSPSWISGHALEFVLRNPLAKDNIIRDTLLNYPNIMKLITWFSLAIEISGLPIGSFYYTRKYYW